MLLDYYNHDNGIPTSFIHDIHAANSIFSLFLLDVTLSLLLYGAFRELIKVKTSLIWSSNLAFMYMH